MSGRSGGNWLDLLHWKPADLKKARWPLLGLVVGILLLTLHDTAGAPSAATPPGAAGSVPASASPAARGAAAPSSGSTDPVEARAERTARSLAALLARVPGAGTVEVHVTLAGSPVQRYAEQVTTSRSTSAPGGSGGSYGGSSGVLQESSSLQPVLESAGAGQAPVPVQTLEPQVVGVLVVASGARDPAVRAELTRAVSVVLGVPVYRVAVLPGTGGR